MNRSLWARPGAHVWLGLALLTLGLMGCGRSEPTPSPTLPATPVSVNRAPTLTPRPTAAPTATPQPTPTPAASPTATPVPTETPTPTATPTVPARVLIEVPGVTLPPGFSLLKFADFPQPTSLTFDRDGHLLASSFNGTIHALTDSDGDGRSDADVQVSWGFDSPLGLAVDPRNGDLYVSSRGKISILRDTNGDLVADEAVNFISGLPNDRHQNDNLKIGPDGWLYMGIGSTCDVCQEVDPRSATIMRFNVDTGSAEIYATGLRNPYDLAFEPTTGALFSTDNGRDDLGLDEPGEELNHIIPGGDYGFPDCWGASQGPGCAGTIPAVALFQAHSSVNSLVFYTGDRFPLEYRGNAFTAVFGSWINGNVERGIWRVQLTPSGDTFTSQQEWFARWPNGWLLGMIVGPDGALYVGDYINGGIYRLSYGLP